MKRWFFAVMLLALPCWAQFGDGVQKLITLKYADPQAVVRLLQVFGLQMQVDNRMKVIALSGNKDRVSMAEEAIKQLDIPSATQKDIELTAYFVIASDSPTVTNQPPNLSGNPIPQDLQSVVATLKNTFPFKTYLLLDVLALRTRSGMGAETSGQLAGNRLSVFKVGSASIDSDGSMIRLDRLHAGVRIPNRDKDGKLDYVDTGLTTDVVDVKEGQKLVVGRSSLDGPDKALFLILIAHVVN